MASGVQATFKFRATALHGSEAPRWEMSPRAALGWGETMKSATSSILLLRGGVQPARSHTDQPEVRPHEEPHEGDTAALQPAAHTDDQVPGCLSQGAGVLMPLGICVRVHAYPCIFRAYVS